MAITGVTDLGNNKQAVTVDHDPTITPTDVPAGSFIIDLNGQWYRKEDDGATTVVQPILQSGGITSGDIGLAAVLSGNIASGQIGSFHIASGAISSGRIGDNAVLSGNIASGQIGVNQLASGVLSTPGLYSGIITSGLIGDGAVVSGSIASGVIKSSISPWRIWFGG